MYFNIKLLSVEFPDLQLRQDLAKISDSIPGIFKLKKDNGKFYNIYKSNQSFDIFQELMKIICLFNSD